LRSLSIRTKKKLRRKGERRRERERQKENNTTRGEKRERIDCDTD
jgi:hypothetical protein